jgi:phosphatidylserine/phosphatidylglycerophosphate/cardiolipin synthase-like enzyme
MNSSLMFSLLNLAFFFLCVIIVLLLIPYIKRQYDDTQEMEKELTIHYWARDIYRDSASKIMEERSKINNVKLLNSAYDISYRLFELIVDAEKSIILSTYRWRVEHDEKTNQINQQIVMIGYALDRLSLKCKLRGKNVRFSILCNQMLLGKETDSWLENHLLLTLSCWKKIGFSPTQNETEPGVYIDFRSWKHVSLGNIHSKFIVVDRSKIALYSMNIEGYSGRIKTAWKEYGVSFDSNQYAVSIESYFQGLFEHTNVVDMFLLAKKSSLDHVATTFPPFVFQGKNATEFSNVPALILMNIPQPDAINRKNPIMQELVPLLRNAVKSIYITSPNLNDIAILNILETKIKQGLDVKIIINKGFNVDAPFIQQTLLGWSTNEQQISSWKQKGLLSHIRWNGNNNEAVIGKVDYQLHAKTFLIDHQSLMIGSLNADIYSTFSSAEIMVLMQSNELSKEYVSQWFAPLWSQSVQIIEE